MLAAAMLASSAAPLYANISYLPAPEYRWTDNPFGANGGATGVVVDAAGNVFVSGFTSGPLDIDAMVGKYSADGQLLWTQTFGFAGDDRATNIALDAAGSVYVLGETGLDSRLMVLRKYTTDGTLVWERGVGEFGNVHGAGLAIDDTLATALGLKKFV